MGDLLTDFLKWCDEPMSANMVDREEMFHKIFEIGRIQGADDATASIFDSVISELEGMRVDFHKMEHDLHGSCDFQHNQTLAQAISKVRAMREGE